jgi:hypothetical protein
MMTMNTCPFLKGAPVTRGANEPECALERCSVWNGERRECWIVTSLKVIGGGASTFRIPASLGLTGRSGPEAGVSRRAFA